MYEPKNKLEEEFMELASGYNKAKQEMRGRKYDLERFVEEHSEELKEAGLAKTQLNWYKIITGK